MPTSGLFRNSPVFAVAGFIAFWFLATLWNFAIEPFFPKLRIRSADSSLAGIAKAEAIPNSADAFWAGQTQKILSNNFGRLLPPFPLAVRAKNQFLYTAFGAAGSNGLVIGRGDQLFQLDYVRDFCARGGALDQRKIDNWADAIRDIQNRVDGSGRAFIYVITPSKAAQYSKYLPDYLNCPARADSQWDKLLPFRAALDARNIRYIDAAGIIRASKANFPIDLFPRGGTHWNLLGAALATRELVKTLDETRRDLSLGAFDFSYRIESEAKSYDRDLLDLMNLLWPDPHYPVPAVEVAHSGEKCPRSARVVELGGSFLHEINILWEHADCAPSVDHWFYFKRSDGFGTWRFEIPAMDKAAGAGRRRSDDLSDLPESVRRADIVLLEENESNLSTMKQISDLQNASATLK